MEVAGIPVAGLTPAAILGIAVLMLFTGQLWTNKAYQAKATEADRWREAYETEREARALSDRQTAELLEVSKTTNRIIVATFGSRGVIRQIGGTSDVAPPT